MTKMNAPNPMQTVLRRNLGVDAFALDGDDTDVADSWLDRRRPVVSVVPKQP